MKHTLETILSEYKRQGSVVMTAKALNISNELVRGRLKRHYEKLGLPTGEFEVMIQQNKINEYTAQNFAYMRKRFSKYPDVDYEFWIKDGKIHCSRPEKTQGEVIGVYNWMSDPDEMRYDIYWYITNYMETQNETAN